MASDITTALKSLCPKALFTPGKTYAEVKWLSKDIPMPTAAEVIAEQDRLFKEYMKTDYQRKRAAEYPPIAEYVDAIVKGDEVQKQNYINACLAVKAKHPKPTK